MVFQREEKRKLIHAKESTISQITPLFQPDTLLPFQYFDLFWRNICLEGEKKLMLAVLEDAIASLQKCYFARDKKGQLLSREVEEWITKEEDGYLFSFSRICELLEINPDYLHRGLLQWKEKQISLPQPSKRKETNSMVKDPVCGMEVAESKAAGSSNYKEETYYFCGKGCKVAFDKEPEKYLSGEKGHSH